MARTTRSTEWAGFRSVLCPIDFSDHSRRALRYAQAIALRARASLRVMYVADPLLIAAAAAKLHDRQFVSRSAKALREFVGATTTPATGTRLKVASHVALGNPPDAILDAASRDATDLIVLGTHGMTGANRLMAGSTTLSVLQQAAVPVLAIPGAGGRLAKGPTRLWPGERIVAGLELDHRAARDVDVAARIAEWFGSSLLLVHVVSDTAAPPWLRRDLSAHERIRMDMARQQLDVLAAHARTRVPTDARVVRGGVADEMAAIAARERTGLLLTALRDRRGWFGARRGSISYHVLSHAVTPVLACPPHWRP